MNVGTQSVNLVYSVSSPHSEGSFLSRAIRGTSISAAQPRCVDLTQEHLSTIHHDSPPSGGVFLQVHLNINQLSMVGRLLYLLLHGLVNLMLFDILHAECYQSAKGNLEGKAHGNHHGKASGGDKRTGDRLRQSVGNTGQFSDVDCAGPIFVRPQSAGFCAISTRNSAKNDKDVRKGTASITQLFMRLRQRQEIQALLRGSVVPAGGAA